ncbi:MAG: FkbM family methyltransferase [Cytophagales bacterium]
MNFFVKGLIRRLRYALFSTHHKDVQRYIALFPKTDFKVVRNGNSYKISFDNSLGYYKNNYEPEFSYSFWTNHFTVRINEVLIQTLINPCCELLCEWRGYTLLKTPQKGDNVIDAGAATGFISLLFAKYVGTGRVYALEPDKRMYRILIHNIKINQIRNIVAINKGLYSETGSFSFDNDTLSLKRISGENSNMIETIDMQTLIDSYKIDILKLSLIKLDIEGAEVDIAEDLANIILKNPHAMAAIASYHPYEASDTGKKIHDIITQNFKSLEVVQEFLTHPTTFIYQKK